MIKADKLQDAEYGSAAVMDGYRRLCYAVLIQGIKDFRSLTSPREVLEVLDFVLNDAPLWLRAIDESERQFDYENFIYKVVNFRGRRFKL